MSQRESSQTLQGLLDSRLRAAIVDVTSPTPCHLVGGAIRDRLAIGKTAHDWDLIVRNHGEIVAERLARRLSGRLVRLGRTRFAAYRIVLAERTVDIWDRLNAPLEQELRRRDLTINSIAMDLTTGEIFDPTNGLKDLEAGVLRANAPERFTEDPLRTLRLLRLYLDLRRFSIDSGTVAAARMGARLLETSASERVREELDRILGRRLHDDFAEVLLALDLFPRLWSPVGTRPPDSTHLTFITKADRRLEMLVELSGESPGPAEIAALHHALLIRASHHEGSGKRCAPQLRQSLEGLVSRRWTRRASAELIAKLLEPVPLPDSDADRRLFVYRYGATWPLAATVASVVATPNDRQRPVSEALEALAHLVLREGESILGTKLLLNGRDLARDYAVEPGPRMGALLDALRQAQVVGSVRTEQEARMWMADQISRSKGSGFED